jgi:excisionase family DNA binding protein
MTETPTLLTVDELAAKLRVSARTVRKWTNRKVIPAVVISQRVKRYDFADVVEALKKQKK